MNNEEIKIQDLWEPNIKDPSTHNRTSFIRGWNEAVNNESLGTAESGKDNWRTVGWHAGKTFGNRDDEFRHTLFLWTTNQRRLALGLPTIDHLSNE